MGEDHDEAAGDATGDAGPEAGLAAAGDARGDVVNLDTLAAGIEDLWAPCVVATVNDWAVKMARVRGEFVWHTHPETDEVFLVHEGSLEIDLREDSGRPGAVRTVHLGAHDVVVVPRGIEHRPRSPHGATLLLVEPAATLNTGDFAGEVPDHITATTGRPR